MCDPITDIISENQCDMIPGSHPLTDNTSISDNRAGIGRTDLGNNRMDSAPAKRTKLLKFVLKRCAWRTHKRIHNGIENESSNKCADDKGDCGIVHNAKRQFSVRAYLRLKLFEPFIILFLCLTILRLYFCYFFIKLFLQLQNLVLKFRYCCLVFIHNLMLGYALLPKDQSDAEKPTVSSGDTKPRRV